MIFFLGFECGRMEKLLFACCDGESERLRTCGFVDRHPGNATVADSPADFASQLG